MSSKEFLLELGAEPLGISSSFTGFGGKANGEIYRLPIFNVGELIYPNMPVVLCEDLFIDKDNSRAQIEYPYHMVLSATMFRDTIYEINHIDNKFKITVPNDDLIKNLKVFSKNGTIEILTISYKSDIHKAIAIAYRE